GRQVAAGAGPQAPASPAAGYGAPAPHQRADPLSLGRSVLGRDRVAVDRADPRVRVRRDDVRGDRGADVYVDAEAALVAAQPPALQGRTRLGCHAIDLDGKARTGGRQWIRTS